jgi:hypothetical protein
VTFQTPWNLELTGCCLSDHLFHNIPFGERMPGLRDEVPAVQLTRELFGLCFVLHGDIGEDDSGYTLECLPGTAVYEQKHSREKQTHDIGPWLAQLIAENPEFKVVGNSPCLMEPQG